MLYEVEDDLLALSRSYPEDVPGLAVDIMAFKLVDAYASCLPFWFHECFAIDRLYLFKTLFVDFLDSLHAKASDLNDLFEVVNSDVEHFPCLVQKRCGDPVDLCLKRDLVDPCDYTSGPQELLLCELKQALILSKVETT